jgi:glycosyltransferase involved in cell wall biosynthesis
MTRKSLHVMMVGLRGFPNVQGGVETHVENLCRELVPLNCAITVLVRSSYQHPSIGSEWNNIQFKKIWSLSSVSLEAIVHTLLGVLYAGITRPDILHIHAIGPALMTPLARLLQLRVVVTHHGEDYRRQKWGALAKWVLRLGERFGMKYSHASIAISNAIHTAVVEKFGVEPAHIPNGVGLPKLVAPPTILEKFEITPRRYVLLVSRFVPEKRHADLIEAFRMAPMPGWKLVFVGRSDHDDVYMKSVKDAAGASGDIVFTGFQGGEGLHALYLHAGVFVLPSSHEGLPIAILEAMSYGLPIIASDIPANRNICDEAIDYFPLSDTHALASQLRAKAQTGFDEQRCNDIRKVIRARFGWSDIAKKTHEVYLQTLQ